VAAEPVRWMAWNALGIAADLQGRHPDARAHYEAALEVLPGNPSVLNNLGYSLLMAQAYAEAETVLREGLRGAPRDPRLRNNLGLALAWQGRYEDALEVMEPALGGAEAANNVGYIALLSGDGAAALRYFDRALELYPRYYALAEQNRRRAVRLVQEGAAP